MKLGVLSTLWRFLVAASSRGETYQPRASREPVTTVNCGDPDVWDQVSVTCATMGVLLEIL